MTSEVMTLSKILIVDDDVNVLRDNQEYFEKMGYETICAKTAEKAEKLIGAAALDCVILDVDLPDGNGFELCERVREKSGLPIVFLSGYTEEQSRIQGLSIGGDDYVCKPYSLQELELRVRARIKARHNTEQPKPLHYGELTIIPNNRTVTFAGRTAAFSVFEFDVLYFLARHPEEVFSYEQIYDQVWKSPINKGIKSLQVIIVRIRQKLMELCPDHEYIQTIRRKGYFFVP